MEEKTQNFWKRYGWLIVAATGLVAILFLLLPVLKYEIREISYNTAGEKLKNDYTYSMNLISYFTTGFKLNFTMYITLGLILVGMILALTSKFKKELLTASGMFYLLAMCMIILSKEFFKADENAVVEYAKIVGDKTQENFSASLHGADLSWGSGLGIAFTNIGFAMTMLGNKQHTVRQIVEEGVLISLAFALNFFKIPVGPTGGSINFQMLPLMIIALRHGPQHGFIAGGIVYGLLTCLTDGYGFACYPFDYLIGFGSVAVMGFFRKFIFSKEQNNYNVKGIIFIAISGLLSTLVRYIGSNVSSIVVYGYTLKAALAYNAFYIPLSGLISVLAFIALYGPLIRINKRYPVPADLERAAQ